MAKAPGFFAFYPSDFIGGTAHLTTLALGAYMRLLCYQWANGSIPREKAKIQRITGLTCPSDVDRVWDEIKDKFISSHHSGDRLVNERMEIERGVVLQKSEKARKSAKARWDSHSERNANALQTQCDGNAIKSKSIKGEDQDASASADGERPTPRSGSSSSSKTPSGKSLFSAEKRTRFAKFWSVSNNKVAKVGAEKAFAKAERRVAQERQISTLDAADLITAAYSEYCQTPAGNPTGRSKTHPATWLNAGQYDDDPDTWHQEGGLSADDRIRAAHERTLKEFCDE